MKRDLSLLQLEAGSSDDYADHTCLWSAAFTAEFLSYMLSSCRLIRDFLI